MLEVSVVTDADAAGLMIRIRLTWWLCPPPVAVTVNVICPVGTVVEVVIVRVESKSGVPDGTLNTGVVPEGTPLTVSATCELNPFNP